MIPKIIHQIAPIDKTRWHPLWIPCRESWLKIFKKESLNFLSDKEDIDNLIVKNFPQYKELYFDFPTHMMRIDFAKFALMYCYGGVYADMDMYCYKDFFYELKDKTYLLECCYGHQPVENAMIASEPENLFFIECMDECKKRFYQLNGKEIINYKRDKKVSSNLILSISGPHLLADMYQKNASKISLLPGELYNNHGLSYCETFRTKHLLTATWGEEVINLVMEKSSSLEEKNSIMIDEYKTRTEKFAKNKIDSTFNFYFDYTDGNFATKGLLEKQKNYI